MYSRAINEERLRRSNKDWRTRLTPQQALALERPELNYDPVYKFEAPRVTVSLPPEATCCPANSARNRNDTCAQMQCDLVRENVPVVRRRCRRIIRKVPKSENICDIPPPCSRNTAIPMNNNNTSSNSLVMPVNPNRIWFGVYMTMFILIAFFFMFFIYFALTQKNVTWNVFKTQTAASFDRFRHFTVTPVVNGYRFENSTKDEVKSAFSTSDEKTRIQSKNVSREEEFNKEHNSVPAETLVDDDDERSFDLNKKISPRSVSETSQDLSDRKSGNDSSLSTSPSALFFKDVSKYMDNKKHLGPTRSEAVVKEFPLNPLPALSTCQKNESVENKDDDRLKHQLLKNEKLKVMIDKILNSEQSEIALSKLEDLLMSLKNQAGESQEINRQEIRKKHDRKKVYFSGDNDPNNLTVSFHLNIRKNENVDYVYNLNHKSVWRYDSKIDMYLPVTES